MIGNYIDIDYDKLPKRQVEEEKKEDKDSSSIKKLLSHPQYKDIIGLYTGKKEAKPVAMTQSLGLDGSGGYGKSPQFALPLSASALPIIGGAAASTAATLRGTVKGPKVNAFRNPSKDEKNPVLDDIRGKVKPQDLPEGVESAKPVESDKGIEGDVEAAREPLLQLLDSYGLSPEDQQAILDILDSGIADLGDDDSFELPEGVQSFKLPPDFKRKALNDILRTYPDLGPKILGNDPAAKQEMDKLMDLLERYMEAKKFKFDSDTHKFNEKDEEAEARRKAAEHNKRAGKFEYHPREKVDDKVTAKDASRSVTRGVSKNNKEESIPESSVMGGSKGKVREEAAGNFERLQRGHEVDTGEPKNKPASWQTKPGPWD